MNSTPQIFYKKLEQNFSKRGYINLEQKEVNSKKDLAEISNIFNSPRYELLRIVYLKNNKIVGYETITSHLPNAVNVVKNIPSETRRFYYKVQNRMTRLKADSYYLIHNHPSGVSYISNDDMHFTQNMMENVRGFKGHLVLGDDNYSFIKENSLHRLEKIEQIPYDFKEVQKINEKIDNFYNNQELKNYKNISKTNNTINTNLSNELSKTNNLNSSNNTIKPYKFFNIKEKLNLNHNLTEEQINFFDNYKVDSRTSLVNLMKAIDMKKDYTPVIMTNSKLKIMMIIDIPNRMFNMSQQQLKGYFRNLAVLNGATSVFLATQNKNVFKNCIKHFKYGTLADLVYYQNQDDKHMIMYEAPGNIPGRNSLFESPKVNMNFASVNMQNGVIETSDKNSIYEEKLNNDENNFDEPNKNQIRILLKRVGKIPLVKVINNTLEEKQRLVGGLIEVVHYDEDNLIIANEEGKVDGLKPNLGFDLDYIAGDCFFIGDDYQNSGFKSLSLEDCERICKEIKNKSFVYDDRESPSISKERER